jgi:hypothetical protein
MEGSGCDVTVVTIHVLPGGLRKIVEISIRISGVPSEIQIYSLSPE